MAQGKRSAQQVRIIGGKWKGRKLRFSSGAAVRPTLGRTRETLFNWLRPHIAGAYCLDAFAGSGVLGLEALSQGAARCMFVERHARTLADIARNIALLDAQNESELVRGDAAAYLKRAEQAFDIVFLDPPFRQPQLLTQAVQAVAANHLARRFVYVEAGDDALLDAAAEQGPYELVKRTRAGDTFAGLLAPDSENLPG